MRVDLGSDRRAIFLSRWYYPVGLSLEESISLADDKPAFKETVYASLRRRGAVNTLSNGACFWDYGNAFLPNQAVPDIMAENGVDFRYQSYVQDIMGPMCFDYGFGPFRWVCTSADPKDLSISDQIAADVVRRLADQAPTETRQQYLDNLRWIEQAEENALVVGSQARILYADDVGRRSIAMAFNEAIADGRISAPIVLGRDHHDVSGTDSPYRETANIYDGSQFCADMAVHNFVGDSFRGATWISLHNGGVGWGEVMNGGFGLSRRQCRWRSSRCDAARRTTALLAELGREIKVLSLPAWRWRLSPTCRDSTESCSD